MPCEFKGFGLNFIHRNKMKHRERKLRKWGLRFVLAIAGFVVGCLLCVLATPLWWKLEGILGVELAGHSGPADWLTLGMGGVFAMIAIGWSSRSLK
jgi:hypothetical protein